MLGVMRKSALSGRTLEREQVVELLFIAKSQHRFGDWHVRKVLLLCC